MGRLLADALEKVAAWRKEKKTYERDCMSKAGFDRVRKGVDSTGKALSTKVPCTFADFVRVVTHWHGHLLDGLRGLLAPPPGGGLPEYMEVRNALLVMARLGKGFPRLARHGVLLEKDVKAIAESDPREDLKTSAGRVLALLQARGGAAWGFEAL